ncbi:MAG: hypothetical protein JSW59_03810 [Phycisphaerales bacterium]|nr:MAG: hypothetical protein JSW59_03810 [Phycisphaerales bacterium]
MKPTDSIEHEIKKDLNFTASVDLHDRILHGILDAQEKSKRKEPAATKPNVWRIIINSRTARLAAAATIILAVMLSINLWNKTVPIVYALDQTIRANHSVRFIHIKEFAAGREGEPKEFWLEFYEDGQVKNMRIHMPAWDYPQDGAKVTVWKENVGQVWFKKKNVLVTVRDKTFADRMLKLVEAFDPRRVVERLYKQQVEGKVKIEIEEPSDKTEPIVVTATSPNRRNVLLVDRATKLVTAIKSYQFKDGEYQYLALVELDNYNEPLEADVFTLGEVPEDVLRIDQTTQEVGLAQGNLTDEAVALEVVRRFFEALIAEDYARAGQLYEGMPAEEIQRMFGGIRVLRIISVGPAGPHPVPATKGLNVPCTVEVERDGERSPWKLDLIGVRQVHNQPGSWTIFGIDKKT